MARYEDTTEFERTVMTSMGYEWRGEGWQRGFSDNEDNMRVEAWVGGPPKKPEPLTNVFEKIADINKPISIHPENDDVVPFGDAAKKIYRDDADKAIGLASGIASDLEKKMQETDKDIANVSSQLEQTQRTEFEKANLNLVLNKLKVKKERLDVLRHEANKSRAHEEYNKYFNEEMFMAYDATSWREDYRKENKKRMTEKREEEQQHKKEAEEARQRVSELEKEQLEKENEVNRLKELDLATEDGLFRAGNEALQNEKNAQNALNDAQNRINQATNDKAGAESVARDYENKAAQAEAKRQEQSKILDEFVKWNTEADYGKDAWWAEHNGWMDSIANLEKERDDATNAARESVNKVAHQLEQANNDKANAENALNNARNTLADVQARKEAIAKAKEARLQELEEAMRKAAAKRKADEEAAKAKAEAEAAERKKDEKEALTKASEIIADMGGKVGEHLGDKYKSVAKEIADDIKNFQGRTLRSYEQTMDSLKKILDNPGMKINKGDKDAIINAWKSFKADDTAKKLANISKAFAVAGVALKIEKVREKSIEGYETGNWAPLMLEVESWVLSGMAAGVALGVFGAILSALPISGLVLTAISIIGIMTISYLASKIDDKIAEKINNEVIRSAN